MRWKIGEFSILTYLKTFSVWLQYAIFEEIDTQDYDRARDVYKAAIKLVPHKQFTFAKVGNIRFDPGGKCGADNVY